MPTTSGRCRATSSRVSSSSVSSTSVGSPSSAVAQRIERRRARGEPLAVARELEARVDAVAPRRRRGRRRRGSRGSAPDPSCRACRTPRERLVARRAAPRRRDARSAALRAGTSRPTMRSARLGIAALQESDRRLDRLDVARRVREEVRDRRRHRRRARAPRARAGAARRPCARASGAENSRRNSPSDASAWRHVEAEVAAVQRARNPVRYAVAGYGVLSWVIGGVRSRTRMRREGSPVSRRRVSV